MIQAPCKYGASMRPAPTQHKASTVSESDFDVSRTKMTASRFFDDDHRGPSIPYRSVIFQKATREKPSKIKAFTYAPDKYEKSTIQALLVPYYLLPITVYLLPFTVNTKMVMAGGQVIHNLSTITLSTEAERKE
jgi:hypothetical protein